MIAVIEPRANTGFTGRTGKEWRARFPLPQEKWAAGQAREREPLAETLERFRLLRRTQLRLFRQASPQAFRRTGFHPERGVVTLRVELETLAGHDLNHLAQIRRLAAQHKAGQ